MILIQLIKSIYHNNPSIEPWPRIGLLAETETPIESKLNLYVVCSPLSVVIDI